MYCGLHCGLTIVTICTEDKAVTLKILLLYSSHDHIYKLSLKKEVCNVSSSMFFLCFHFFASHVHTYTCACIHACMCQVIHKCTHSSSFSFIHTHTCTQTHTHTHIHTLICTHPIPNACAHTHTLSLSLSYAHSNTKFRMKTQDLSSLFWLTIEVNKGCELWQVKDVITA